MPSGLTPTKTRDESYTTLKASGGGGGGHISHRGIGASIVQLDNRGSIAAD